MSNADWLEALHDRDRPPIMMGILNVTPDSFSDGGKFTALERAEAHAKQLVAEGATLIDVGGESTRPGAEAVPDAEQCRRVLPVLEALSAWIPPHVTLSIDTRSAEVARAAIATGASLVNDVSGGRDPAMLDCVAATGASLVLMHMQGDPTTMQREPRYEDVVGEVETYLLAAAQTASRHGIAKERLLLDPGIGFGKNRAHNLALLAALPRFVALGYPILLGTSRKRFMGAICRETVFTELVGATCATTALGTMAGVRVFRVHDVKANRQAMEVARAISSGV